MARHAKVVVIGAGFAGLSAATHLAARGFDVTLIEKHNAAGGRARRFCEAGFMFDMGPSWYWMPDVFERYFNHFGRSPADYYDLKRLDPSYRAYFGKGDYHDIPADLSGLMALFERLETGSGLKLQKFLEQASYKYAVGINDLVYKSGRSIREFLSVRLLTDLFKLDLFTSFASHIKKYFQNERILRLIEFPILFLGATAEKTPALYSFMNYADLQLGTWYPMGGIGKVADAMMALAEEKGVKFRLGESAVRLEVKNGRVRQAITDRKNYAADLVVAGADYHHVETRLLDPKYRSYSENYWNSRKMAPSALLFYIGLNKKLTQFQHHNLFFHEDFSRHAAEIYQHKTWPSNPLFYVCVPSVTDASTAPEGCENLFILMPAAPGLEDSEDIRQKYFNLIIGKIEELTGEKIRKHIIYTKSYAHNNFINDYNAFKGNAYGLANTLRQTAMFKPSVKSRKVKNLYYTGQLTAPGPGVPPALISGNVVANEIEKDIMGMT